MIRGRIAIPDKDPKTRRAKGRKKRKQAAIASAIVTPAPMKKRKGPVIRSNEPTGPKRSAIVEPKQKPALDDYDPEAHRRAGEKANELFREIKRRIAASKRD